MKALPDAEIEVQRRQVTDDAILVQVMFGGTHLGEWRGPPATGRGVEFPLCGVYTFDSDDRLAGKRSTTTGGRCCPTRRFQRAAKCVGANVHLRDSSGHDCTCFRVEIPAQVTSSVRC
jgi:hypothetical protein